MRAKTRGNHENMTATRAEPISTGRLDLLPLRVEYAKEMAAVLADPALYIFTRVGHCARQRGCQEKSKSRVTSQVVTLRATYVRRSRSQA